MKRRRDSPDRTRSDRDNGRRSSDSHSSRRQDTIRDSHGPATSRDRPQRSRSRDRDRPKRPPSPKRSPPRDRRDRRPDSRDRDRVRAGGAGAGREASRRRTPSHDRDRRDRDGRGRPPNPDSRPAPSRSPQSDRKTNGTSSGKGRGSPERRGDRKGPAEKGSSNGPRADGGRGKGMAPSADGGYGVGGPPVGLNPAMALPEVNPLLAQCMTMEVPVDAGPRISGAPTLFSIYHASVLMPGLVRLEALLPSGLYLETPALALLLDHEAPREPGQGLFCKVVAVDHEGLVVTREECHQTDGRDLNPCPDFRDITEELAAKLSKEEEEVVEEVNPLALFATSQQKASAKEEEGGFSFGFNFGEPEPETVVESEEEEEDEEDDGLFVSTMAFSTPPFMAGEPWKNDATVNVMMDYRAPKFLKGIIKDKGALMPQIPITVTIAPEGSMLRAALCQAACMRERRARDRLNGVEKVQDWDTPSASKGASSKAPVDTEWHHLHAQRMELPIFSMRAELMSAVYANQVLVVIGATGSGKTTQLTQYLVEDGFAPLNFCVGCTQPRRIAAITVARRVAQEVGCMLGSLVGYGVRFEDCTSPLTKIKYMTDGLLLREGIADRKLAGYSALIIDEAHERALTTDILFGLLKDVLTQRPDLKLIITSATLDAQKFSAYFGNCPILTIPGRSHPVEIIYSAQVEMDYVEAAVQATLKVHTTEPTPGDILVFMTGQEEIEVACQSVQTYWRDLQRQGLGDKLPELIVLPVFAAMPPELQARIFDPPPPNTRKAIFATNIAETSLTIDGVVYVIDCGFVKQRMYDSKTASETLKVVPISQMSAKQRAGRAGRTAPGKCYRLYTEAAFTLELPADTVPEICRANLSHVVLTLKAMGVADLLAFDFLDSPNPQGFVDAMSSLHGLAALDDDGNLTNTGRRMAELPLDPMLARMLLAACDFGCASEVLIITAVLSAGNIFYRPKQRQAEADAIKAQFIHTGGDHLTYLNVFRRWERTNYASSWCHANCLNVRLMTQAYEIREQLADLLMRRFNLSVSSTAESPGVVQKAICTGYFSHVARRTKDGWITLSPNSSTVVIHPSSIFFGINEAPPWLIYHELLQTSRGFMRDIVAINPLWLPELAPNVFDIRPETSTAVSRLGK